MKHAILIGMMGLLSTTAWADTCPNFSGSYVGTRTITATNINVSPPVDETSDPGISPKYTIIQKGCEQIEIDTIGDGQLFGSGKATYTIGGLTSSVGSTIEQGFALTSGIFVGNNLVLATADRNPDDESTGTESFIFTTLSKNAKGKLVMSTSFNTHFAPNHSPVKFIETFQEN
jgi:hypothetical protein